MGNSIKFENFTFDEAIAFRNRHENMPGKDSVGFFDEYEGCGQFFWFSNENELKHFLLNGWYSCSTTERDDTYYDNVLLLRVILEMSASVDSIWEELPKDLLTDMEILWSGNIQELLTDEGGFAFGIREIFKDILIDNEIEWGDELNTKDADLQSRKLENDLDLPLVNNKIIANPDDSELLQALYEFVKDFCYG